MKRSDLQTSEYNPFYHNYILALGDITLKQGLVDGRDEFLKLLDSIPDSKMTFAYAADKWTLAELLIHIIDTERVFQYRALRFARNDRTPLPGFEQNDYVPNSGADSRTKKNIVEEYKAVRESTIVLFNTFDEKALKRAGVASGSDMSTRAMGFVICGHQAHHLKIIRERYL
ncbi:MULTISPECIES: DinB family protein [Flavobacteriaceae]|uniref:DinB family protein n=1 Tax=Flavobacteriaceae TaxID=49546 RepID=UPI0014912D52|nr:MULTISPECIES: DinB family protein [Allomuricauda]MDC6364595.1 DinB family protein [Muricauda sp. AC10]